MLYQYRYLWQLSSSVEGEAPINQFCVLTDSVSNLESFENRIKALPNLVHFVKEYLCEIDTSKLFVVSDLFDNSVSEVKNEA